MCGKCLAQYDASSVRTIAMEGSGEESHNLIQQVFAEPGTTLGAGVPAESEHVPALGDG